MIQKEVQTVTEVVGYPYKEIKLTNGGVALVSAEDFEKVNKYKWHKRTSDGYAARTEYNKGNFKTIRMHQIIIDVPKGMVTDHINGDRLDNRRENLRPATRSQNTANSIKPNDNTSGYKGVYYRKDQGKWRASIRLNGKAITLGQYEDIKDAARAYNRGALKYFGEFARLNVIKEDE